MSFPQSEIRRSPQVGTVESLITTLQHYPFCVDYKKLNQKKYLGPVTFSSYKIKKLVN